MNKEKQIYDVLFKSEREEHLYFFYQEDDGMKMGQLDISKHDEKEPKSSDGR